MFFKSISNELYMDVTIPSLFFTIFMPIANGNQLKVYFLGYKSAFFSTGLGNDGLDNKKIGNIISASEEEVEKIWEYWESMKIVKIHRVGEKMSVEFLDIKDQYISKHISPKENNLEVEEITDTGSSPNYIKMFSLFETRLGRILAPNEKMDIINILDKLEYQPEMMEVAFSQTMDKYGSLKSIKYLESILRSWKDNKIETVEDIEEFEKKFRDRNVRYRKVFKALGFNRGVGDFERDIMDRWFEEYDMSMDVILKACENIANTSNPNLKYFDSIITNWYNQGVKTVEDAERVQLDHDKKKQEKNEKKENQKSKPKVNKPKKTKFHNFKQSSERDYTDEELNSFISNVNIKKK